MPSITKKKYVGELMRYNKTIKRPLYLIAEILPQKYDGEILLEYLKKYYPIEWEHLVQMQNSYLEKDKFLVSVGKKARYKPLLPEIYFFSLPVVKNILRHTKKENYTNSFNQKTFILKLNNFEDKRKLAIGKRNAKIEINIKLIQNIDPYYVDYYIATYHKKGNSIEDKVEIVKDLSKYKSKKIDAFFSKLNDSEHNNQVRKMAFDYLQQTGTYVRLRKNFKGKKKIYMTEMTSFKMTPEDLFRKIVSRNIQIKKTFDLFISHSFSDQIKIISLFKFLNTQGLVCYCDWTSDNDFLKRNMAGKYTEEVLKKRIEQSKCVLYVNSKNVDQSRWVKFELEYARSIKKEIKKFNIDNLTIELISNEILKVL